MSFEDEKLEEAMKVLQETEKLCDTDAGVLKSIKNRFKSKKKREVMLICFPWTQNFTQKSTWSDRYIEQVCSNCEDVLTSEIDNGLHFVSLYFIMGPINSVHTCIFTNFHGLFMRQFCVMLEENFKHIFKH